MPGARRRCLNLVLGEHWEGLLWLCFPHSVASFSVDLHLLWQALLDAAFFCLGSLRARPVKSQFRVPTGWLWVPGVGVTLETHECMVCAHICEGRECLVPVPCEFLRRASLVPGECWVLGQSWLGCSPAPGMGCLGATLGAGTINADARRCPIDRTSWLSWPRDHGREVWCQSRQRWARPPHPPEGRLLALLGTLMLLSESRLFLPFETQSCLTELGFSFWVGTT